MNEFTADGIVIAMTSGFAITTIALTAITIWLVDKCDRQQRRLDSIEWYLEMDSASRRPAHAPPPPPPFTRNT